MFFTKNFTAQPSRGGWCTVNKYSFLPQLSQGPVDNWFLRQPIDDTISLPKSKGEFSIFPTKTGFFSEYSQRKHLSTHKKRKLSYISLHNEIYKQPLNDINRELSTFSTGFSTSVHEKSVDNSRSNFVYTIFSTALHNCVEDYRVNIIRYLRKRHLSQELGIRSEELLCLL